MGNLEAHALGVGFVWRIMVRAVVALVLVSFWSLENLRTPAGTATLGAPGTRPTGRVYCVTRGPLAQLGERRLCTAEVSGSNPLRSTTDLQGFSAS